MYINTFKYTPADVDCKLCTEYVKKFGCTACGCPWMAERIEAGVVSYAEVVRQMFPHDKRLMARLEPLIRDFPGMLWQDERHRQRMEGCENPPGPQQTPGHACFLCGHVPVHFR